MCFWNCELICWKKILPSRHNFLTTKINKNNQQVFIYMFTFSHPETHRGPKVRKSKRRRSIKRQPWSRLKHLERTWGLASATTESVRNQHLEPAGTIRNKKFKNSHQKYQEIYHKMITKIVCVCIVFIQKMYIKYEILLRSTSSFVNMEKPPSIFASLRRSVRLLGELSATWRIRQPQLSRGFMGFKICFFNIHMPDLGYKTGPKSFHVNIYEVYEF